MIYWFNLILADERWTQYYQQGEQGTFTVNGVSISPAPGQ